MKKINIKLAKEIDKNNSEVEDEVVEIDTAVADTINSTFAQDMEKYSINNMRQLSGGVYIPTIDLRNCVLPSSYDTYNFDYTNMYPTFVNDGRDTIKDQYEKLLEKIEKHKTIRYKKIKTISLENIKNIIKIDGEISKYFNINYISDTEGDDVIDIFDIPDINIYNINARYGFYHATISTGIYRKIRKMDYSFIVDNCNNSIYIMFDNETDLAKFKMLHIGV